MKKYAGTIYVTLLAVIGIALITASIPGIGFLGSWATPPVLLFMGLLFVLVFGQPCPGFNKKMSKMLLQYSVVGLGFGMNVEASLASGKEGMMFTIISVFGTLLVGWLVGRVLLKVDRNTSYLISSGTAICGGSAIAAVGPVIKAKECEMSVALGTVFVLNAVALFIFPPIGRYLGLDDVQFGTWAAIAIHDTSSVVGAGAAYSEAALEVATTIKLTRALWIVPVALVTCVLFKSKDRKIKVPCFILWFVIAMLVNTYLFDSVPQVGKTISVIARKCLTLTMFFIGASLSPAIIRQVGVKPLLQGVILWVLVSVVTLVFIMWC